MRTRPSVAEQHLCIVQHHWGGDSTPVIHDQAVAARDLRVHVARGLGCRLQ